MTRHLNDRRYPSPCGVTSCRICYPPTPAEAREARAAAWDTLQQTELQRFAEAVDQLNAAMLALITPAALAILNAAERLADAFADLADAAREDWRESIPGRLLNRAARRAAMRRHPAGRLTIVQLDVAGDAGQPDAGSYPSAAELAARAGIRLPDPAGDVELPAPHWTHSMWWRRPDSGECDACGLCTCCDSTDRTTSRCPAYDDMA